MTLFVALFSWAKGGSEKAGAGSTGGGTTVTVEERRRLRELVDDSVCQWQRGYNFVANEQYFPNDSYHKLVNFFEETHWDFVDHLNFDLASLKICLTRGQLKDPTGEKEGEKIVVTPYFTGEKLTALRFKNEVYIQVNDFEQLPASDRPFLFFHEQMHAFFPQNLPRRMGYLRSFVLAVSDQYATGRPFLNEDFLFQVEATKMAKISKIPAIKNKHKQFYRLNAALTRRNGIYFKWLVEELNHDVNSLNQYGKTPLLVQACIENIEGVNILRQFPGVNANATNPLEAEEGVSFKIGKTQLVAYNCETDSMLSPGHNALMYAVRKNNPELLAALLKFNDIDINQLVDQKSANRGGQGPLHYAVMDFKNPLMIRQFIKDKRTDINLSDSYSFFKMTPLMYSIHFKNLKAFDEIIQSPMIDVNIRTDAGKSALSVAVSTYHPNSNYVSKLSKRFGGTLDPNINNQFGVPILFSIIAAKPKGRREDLVNHFHLVDKYLRLPGLGINFEDSQGNTVIHALAKASPDLAIASLVYNVGTYANDLLTYLKDVHPNIVLDKKNKSGQTALEIAQSGANPNKAFIAQLKKLM